MILMGNKHDEFGEYILARTAAGAPRQAIARELAAKGVKTTGSQIYEWMLRRSKRIARDLALIDPIGAAKAAQAQPPTSPQPSAPQTPEAPTTTPASTGTPPAALAAPAHQEAPPTPPKPATAAPAPVADFRKRGTLNIDIGNEEDLIAERKRQDPLGLLSKKKPE